mgnify:CR=1 FL=1
MPLINTAVPILIQVVSQQSDATRFAGQCEEQENALSSVADGLKKRPNTRHIARLIQTEIGKESFVHFINRSDSEKYVVIVYKEYDSSNVHTGCKMRAFNVIDGTEASINSITGGYTISDTQFKYLHTAEPKSSLNALSIGDTTLLLNKTQAVAPKTEKTAALTKEGLVTILQGGYEKTYRVEAEVIPEGAGQQPANLVMPSVTFTLAPYLYESRIRSHGVRGVGKTYTYYYRHAVSGFSITQAGANLDGQLNFTFTSNLAIYTQPIISAVITDGALTNLIIRNGGSFEGSGDYNVSSGGASTGSNKYYGQTAPTGFNHTVSGGYISTAVTLNTSATSGSSANNNSAAANTSTIASALQSNMNNDGFLTYFGINRKANDSSIYLSLTTQTDADFTLSTSDDLANSGMKAIYKEIDSITSLPVKNKNGFRIKVKGDVELSEDDYYVEFQTNQGQAFGEGSYVETVGFDIIKGYEPSTMPHSLINNAVNSFVLEETNFEDRLAGDDLSNPLPSFVGSEIEAMFFFKNRLGFLSKENVIISEAGFGVLNDDGKIVFNFGRTSITTLLDSAPIDVSVASSRVTNLKSAKGFQENLILFSENGQFVLKGGDVLTPKTVSITPITNFSFEDQVDPLPLGSYLYFPFTRGEFTGMREFTINANTDVYNSIEVTEHVPAYIPKDIIDMAGTTSEDMIVLLSNDEKGSLYIYNYFWNNNQKVLSAWSKFTFTGEIRGVEFIESTLYAIATNNGETNLVEMPLESGLTDAAGFVTHLDMRVASTVTNGSNTITLPYTPADNSVEVYTTDGLKLNATNSGATVTLTQAVTADTDVFVGIPYTMKYTFSEQLFKARAGQGSSPSNAANLMVRNGSIYFDKTAFFKVKVTPKHRDTTENVFTPDIVGSSTLGSLNLNSGFYRFPVFTKAQDTTITIENESALPSNFQSAEFESFLHSRSNRYG